MDMKIEDTILSVPMDAKSASFLHDASIKMMETEIQIRTIAMDFWASLEHQLKYKKDIADEGQIIERLRICAETIAKTDTDMLQIRRSIERCADISKEEDLLMERLRDINISV